MERNDIPVIKPFVCNGLYYVYDAFKNQILRVNKEIYIEICRLQKVGLDHYFAYDDTDTGSAYSDILMLHTKGFFQKPFVERISNYDDAYIPLLLDRCVSTLQIQVTQDCNFSCRYCQFAGRNETMRRHTGKSMSEETAKKSVDFLFDHSKDVSDVFIYYYGGEPLLNFDLIRLTTKYAKQKFNEKNVTFIAITNGALLDDSVVDFFEENDIVLIISFDGEKEIQNGHRKRKGDGGDTYDTVLGNILQIKNNHGEYYKRNVKFNAVSFYDEDREKLDDFFQKVLQKGTHAVNVIFPDVRGIDYIYDRSAFPRDGGKKDHQKEHEKVLTAYKYKNENCSIWYGSGNCIPGIQKLFVSVDGNFYPCEKVEESEAFTIGNLQAGFNLEKVIAIAQLPNIIVENCRRCWAIKFCSTCLCYCTDNATQTISKEVRFNYCKKTHDKVLELLKEYVRENEHG